MALTLHWLDVNSTRSKAVDNASTNRLRVCHLCQLGTHEYLGTIRCLGTLK